MSWDWTISADMRYSPHVWRSSAPTIESATFVIETLERKSFPVAWPGNLLRPALLIETLNDLKIVHSRLLSTPRYETWSRSEVWLAGNAGRKWDGLLLGNYGNPHASTGGVGRYKLDFYINALMHLGRQIRKIKRETLWSIRQSLQSTDRFHR